MRLHDKNSLLAIVTAKNVGGRLKKKAFVGALRRPDAATSIELYRTMLRIRLAEQRITEVYPSDKIQSPIHLSVGQEAIAAGVCRALAPSDHVHGTYRGHAFYIAKGGNLDAMFAELYGRMGGVSKGKAGSMHLSAPGVGLMGSSAVVASSIPHAVGAALSFKRRGTSQIAIAVFGDGAGAAQLDDPVVDFAGQQAQRQADHAGGVAQHPFHRQMGLPRIGGAQHRHQSGRRRARGAVAHDLNLGFR